MAKTTLLSPFGKASLVHINEPDTFKGSTKYKMVLSFATEEDTQLFTAKIKQAAEGERFDTKKPKMPWVDDEKYGRQFKMSSKFKPGIFDTKNNPIEDRVSGGSTVRVNVEIFNYKDGLSLRLLQVQVKELSRGSGGSSAFDEVDEGYVGQSSSFKSDDDESGNDTSALDI